MLGPRRTTTSTRRKALAVTLVIAVVLSCGRLREDEAYCEEALARLKECCGSATVSARQCEFESGCDSSRTPDFSVAAARCLLDTPCEALRESGKCTSLASDRPREGTSLVTSLEEEACR